MKKLLTPFLLSALTSGLFAGGTPGGPWAQGAYFPGQLDGRYSANVYNDVSEKSGVINTNKFTTNTVGGVTVTNLIPGANNVLSGILGFGIRNGTPAVTSSTSGSSSGANQTNANTSLQNIGLDSSLNYFLIYVNGDAFAGTTAANINPDSSKVSGVLANGSGRVSYLVFTNQQPSTGGGPPANVGITVFSIPGATANGYFNAKVKNNKSPYIFKGNGALTVQSTIAGGGGASASEGTYPFKVDGIKSSENSMSGYSQTGRNAP